MQHRLTSKNRIHMNGFNYYRLKMCWQGEGDDGGITKIKTEELVYATSYTEAEKIAYALIEQENRAQHGDVTLEIIKTKIEELVYNDILQKDDNLTQGFVNCFFEESDDSGSGLYGVKVLFITVDERSGKEKRSHSTIYTPANSNADASAKITNYLKNSVERGEAVIRNAVFDPTVAILWPKDYYQQIANN